MKTIPLGGKWGVGKVLKVSDEDYEWASKKKWIVSKRGYPVTWTYDSAIFKGRKTWAKGRSWVKSIGYHQLVMGKRPGYFVDHIDGDPCNGQRENFRWVTPAQSVRNTGTWKQYKGITYYKTTGINQYKCEIMVNWKKTHIGVWPNDHIAALAYDFWAVQLHGEYARTNFKVVSWG